MAVTQESLEFVLRATAARGADKTTLKSFGFLRPEQRRYDLGAEATRPFKHRCEDGAPTWAWGSVFLLIFVPYKVHCTLQGTVKNVCQEAQGSAGQVL